MAVFALRLFVCAIEPVFGALVMVKVPGRPGTGVVANLTAFTELQFVLVVFCVARVAITRGFLEQGALVAVLADDRNVTPRQGEPAQVVIELVDLP